MYPSKNFSNGAPTPIFVAVTAESNGQGIITAIHAAGGTLGFSEDHRAESQRMFNWIRRTFIGQSERFFQSHNGLVPDSATLARMDFADIERRVFASGMVDPLNLDQRDRRFTTVTSEQAEEFIYRNLARALGLDYEELMRDNRATEDKQAHADILRAAQPEVGHEEFASSPHVGTYWQDRERPVRFFLLISKHECEGHTHMRMLRVDHARGGEYEFIYESGAKWNDAFQRVAAVDVPGNSNTGKTVVLMDRGTCKVSFDGYDPIPASELTDQQIKVVVDEHGEAHPGLREFLEEQRPQRRIEFPAALGEPYEPGKGGTVGFRVPLSELKTKKLPFKLTFGDEPDAYAKAAAEMFEGVQYRPALDGVPRYMQQFLDALDFTGRETPPAVGERYFSWISGATYKVVDVTRKLHQTDYYVTMEREPDGRRAKYTYRDHATWLATWRPADDEGNARPVEMVDVDLTVIDNASDAMRQMGTAAHEAAEAVMDFRETDAERQLRVIYAELDRKAPGWREAGDGDHVFLDDVSLAKRAIRSLYKHMNNYCSLAQTSNAELSKTTAAYLKVCGEKARLEREMRDVIAGRRGGWDAARVRVEQDSTREMLRLFTSVFARAHGSDCAKLMLSAFNATTLASLPPELHVAFMARCEEYARRNEG